MPVWECVITGVDKRAMTMLAYRQTERNLQLTKGSGMARCTTQHSIVRAHERVIPVGVVPVCLMNDVLDGSLREVNYHCR